MPRVKGGEPLDLEKFTELLGQLTDPSALVREGLILCANPALAQWLGWTPDELACQPITMLAAPDDADSLRATFAPERAGEPYARVQRLVHRDGRPVSAQVSVSRLDAGELVILRRVPAAGRTPPGLLEAAVDHLREIVFITEADRIDSLGRRVVYANRAFRDVSGWSGDEVLGRTPDLTIGPETDRETLKRIGSALAAGQASHEELRKAAKDGAPYWVEIDILPVRDDEGRHTHWVSVQRDITERRRLEESTREAYASMRQLLESTADGIIQADRGGAITWANRATEDMFGWPLSALVGQSLTCLMPERLRPSHEAGIARFLRSGKRHVIGRVVEIVGLRRDGTEIPIELSVTFTPLGGVPGFSAIVRDVTERRRAEANLRGLVEALPMGVVVWRDGRVLYANSAFDALLGRAPDAHTHGMRVGELIAAHALAEDRARLAEWMLSTVQGNGPSRSTEVRLMRADGHVATVQTTTVPLTYDGRRAHATLALDVTEHRALQARVLQSDRLAALGTLAACVAHEINNPLTYILGNAVMASDMIGAGNSSTADVLELLGEAVAGAERVRDIVRDLRIFSRTDAEKREPVNVHTALETALRMSRVELRHRADLVRDLEPVPAVTGDEARLSQVFLNLLINAVQSLPEGRAGKHTIRVATRLAGDRVAISIRDTGEGIPPDVLGRLFDPFFTTKRPGVGTGLGLAICHGIVSRHGGTIEVDSTVGEGTEVRVLLPVGQGGAQRPAPPPPPPPGRRGRVLVVDDDFHVARATVRVLDREHDAVSVDSGRAALALLAVDRDFDVVLCDLMMPEMTGIELHAEIATRLPELLGRLVFVTGGAFTHAAREFLTTGVTFLEKPLDLDQLRATIRQRVDGR